MRTREELLAKIEYEVNDTERRLAFWRQQEGLHTDSELGKCIGSIVDGYDRQLRHLESARKLFNA